MKTYLLPDAGRFYKANLHCHSTWSDGVYTPEELKEQYRSHGYSVLAITDHEGLFSHGELNESDFLTLTGMELEFNEEHGPNWDHVVTCHLCAIRKDPSDLTQPGYDPAYDHPKFTWLHDPEKAARIRGDGRPFVKLHTPENLNEVIRRLTGAGFFVTWNHPKWSQEFYPAYSQYVGMDAMEVYNNATFLGGHDERNGPVYDDLLRLLPEGKRLFITANDDTHDPCDLFGGFTMIKAEKLDYPSIIRALEAGHFYASTGPLIESLTVEDGALTVRSETPLRYIRLITGTRQLSLVRGGEDSPVYEGRFPVRADVGYMRLGLAGLDGSTAWTNAYPVRQLMENV